MNSFSIVIPVYNRAQDLSEMLESLARQDYPADKFELIVVDDGSEDDIRAVCDEIRKHHPVNIRYFRQPNQGPGIARNTGMDQACMDIIIFIDSDCIIPGHYLSCVNKAFEHGEIDAYGGPDTSMDTFSPWDKAVNYVMTSFLTTGGLRGSGGRKLARYYPRSFNMGFRRSLYKQIGKFGSIFQYGEDIEFSHRLLKVTPNVTFLPEANVFHKRRSSLRAFARQIFKMGKARIQLARMDRNLLEPLYLAPAFLLLILLALVAGSFFSGTAAALLMFLVAGGVIWLLLLSVHGLIKTGSLISALLIPAAFCIQAGSYGAGVLTELMNSVIHRNRSETSEGERSRRKK